MGVARLVIEHVTEVDPDELVALYDAVGWSAYTRAPDVLRAAVAGSSYVVTARRGRRLIGLARAVSDDATICYLQDILVVPDEQRSGVGRALLSAVLARYGAVRQKVLLTDDEPRQKAFYESLGFTEVGGTLRAFARFDDRPELTAVTDLSATGWVLPRLRPFEEHVVTSLLPTGFEAYLRVDHPQTGTLDDGRLDMLIPILSAATGISRSCWFCLWDGYGFLHPGSVAFVSAGGTAESPPGRSVAELPRLCLPARDYLVFTGPVEAATEVGIGLGPYSNPHREGPNLWWPDDRAWVVASDIDLPWTYLAGSATLAEAIRSADGLDAHLCDPTDPITA